MPATPARFRSYHRELAEWNARANLTAVTGSREVQTRHFLDSLTVGAVISTRVPDSGRVPDVGAGAGFPGVLL